jgi:protein-S-isoprenylcysteine O-methyltransferase Ste14
MKATNWEFANRALLFGLILGFSFPLYFLDHQNATAALADWLGSRLQRDPDLIARLLFAFAAVLLMVAALIRTWASAYLQAGVVYAAELKTESLVADGPYRQVRNPLYFANVLMVIGMGDMMSRAGILVAVMGMLIFCYLWPALWPRIASAGRQARWADGFKAESWYWGFAAALVAFAITLKLTLFFAILTASLVLFWVSTEALQKKKSNTPS